MVLSEQFSFEILKDKTMTNYNIYKQTPNNKYIIHKNFTDDQMVDFMTAMAQGGYDGSLEDCSLSAGGYVVDCMDGGDRISFIASEISEAI